MEEHYPFTNEPLPYAYDALEPYIDERTMELHHSRHLQTYVDNLNEIVSRYPGLQRMSLKELILNVPFYPWDIQQPLLDNAGGVYNHKFFFAHMSPNGNRRPSEELQRKIEKEYGSYEAFEQILKEYALSVFGSGYAWLVMDGRENLEMIITHNQDVPFQRNRKPLMGIDVWEHAYYLKHYNDRSSYVDDWLQVVNWLD